MIYLPLFEGLWMTLGMAVVEGGKMKRRHSTIMVGRG